MVSLQIKIDLTDSLSGFKYSDKIRCDNEALLLIDQIGPMAENLYRGIKLKMQEDKKARELK